MENVKIVLLFSGKRKCGKDFITGKLLENHHQFVHRLGSVDAQIIRISAPIKTEFSQKFNLNLDELLSDSPYKEKYRKEMIEWSDKVRSKDYGFFCREAIKEASRKILIVSDIRRKNDIRYFREIFGDKVRTIRVNCSDEIRSQRGWTFREGVDDVKSECDLDDFESWDLQVVNDGNDINKVLDFILGNILSESL